MQTNLNLAFEEKNLDSIHFYAHKLKATVNLLSILSIKEDILYLESGKTILKSKIKSAKALANINFVLGEAVEELLLLKVQLIADNQKY